MWSGKSLQLLCILPFGMLCLSAISMMFVKIMLYLELFDIASHGCGLRQERHPVVKTLLQYSSLTPLESECYEGEVQPYRKTDYKPMMMMMVSGLLIVRVELSTMSGCTVC